MWKIPVSSKQCQEKNCKMSKKNRRIDKNSGKKSENVQENYQSKKKYQGKFLECWDKFWVKKIPKSPGKNKNNNWAKF